MFKVIKIIIIIFVLQLESTFLGISNQTVKYEYDALILNCKIIIKFSNFFQILV